MIEYRYAYLRLYDDATERELAAYKAIRDHKYADERRFEFVAKRTTAYLAMDELGRVIPSSK